MRIAGFWHTAHHNPTKPVCVLSINIACAPQRSSVPDSELVFWVLPWTLILIATLVAFCPIMSNQSYKRSEEWARTSQCGLEFSFLFYKFWWNIRSCTGKVKLVLFPWGWDHSGALVTSNLLTFDLGTGQTTLQLEHYENHRCCFLWSSRSARVWELTLQLLIKKKDFCAADLGTVLVVFADKVSHCVAFKRTTNFH